jgi:hypothetical protein
MKRRFFLMIYSLVNDCIISEKERGLSEATIKELKRYLHEFAGYFQKKLTDIENLTSDFLRQYVEHRGKGQGTDLVKAVVWSPTFLLLSWKIMLFLHLPSIHY